MLNFFGLSQNPVQLTVQDKTKKLWLKPTLSFKRPSNKISSVITFLAASNHDVLERHWFYFPFVELKLWVKGSVCKLCYYFATHLKMNVFVKCLSFILSTFNLLGKYITDY